MPSGKKNITGINPLLQLGEICKDVQKAVGDPGCTRRMWSSFLFFFSPISLSVVLVTLESPQLFRKLPRFWQLLFCFKLGPGNCLSRKHQGKAVVLGLCKKERRLFLKVWFVLNRLSNLYLTAFESTLWLPLILPPAEGVIWETLP